MFSCNAGVDQLDHCVNVVVNILKDKSKKTGPKPRLSFINTGELELKVQTDFVESTQRIIVTWESVTRV